MHQSENATVNDELFKYDAEEQKKILNAKPWLKRLPITHSNSGGNIEIMGVMMGKIIGDSMIVIDSIALPVVGTETRVNAQAEGNEYMVEHIRLLQQVGREENVIGWYHSHPGYGCWLSGIDVNTQLLNQQFQEPFVAIVIDPFKTNSSGKVDIGGFRTYPNGYIPSNEDMEYQNVPLDKIEEFGVHSKKYYPLEISYFKSSLDESIIELLQKSNYINNLSAPAFTKDNLNFMTKQINDLAKKMENITSKMKKDPKIMHKDNLIEKCSKESHEIMAQAMKGLLSMIIKEQAFGQDDSIV